LAKPANVYCSDVLFISSKFQPKLDTGHWTVQPPLYRRRAVFIPNVDQLQNNQRISSWKAHVSQQAVTVEPSLTEDNRHGRALTDLSSLARACVLTHQGALTK